MTTINTPAGPAGEREPEAIAFVITIVGAVRPPIAPGVAGELVRRVEAALVELVPDFLPAYPACTIQTADLRDDWIRRPPSKEQ